MTTLLGLGHAVQAQKPIAGQPTELPPAPPESHNVEYLGELAPDRANTRYGDVWGFNHPSTGVDYALLASMAGVHVINCSDPRAPRQTGMIPSPAPYAEKNGWRDIKVFGRYAYAVSQAHPGMQIIDLADPENPTLVRLWGTSIWSGGHNLVVDPERGHLWVLGTPDANFILDIGSNPTEPTLIKTFNTPKTFDLTITGDYAYVADIFGNSLVIFDLTQLPSELPVVSSTPMPGIRFAHSAYASEDGNLCVTSNESPGGPVAIWNTSNKLAPEMLATYRANPVLSPLAYPHHVYLDNYLVHVAHWTEGYRLLDISTPTNPVEVGFYDTLRTRQNTNFFGAWGCYHLADSGIIYIGDTQRGLVLVKPRATPTFYGDTTLGKSRRVPDMSTFGSPFLGNSQFRVRAQRLPPNKPGFLILGLGRGTIPVGTLTLNVSWTPIKPLVVPLTSGELGRASVPLPLPNMADLDGLKLDLQFVFVDDQGPSPEPSTFQATKGLEIELFSPK